MCSYDKAKSRNLAKQTQQTNFLNRRRSGGFRMKSRRHNPLVLGQALLSWRHMYHVPSWKLQLSHEWVRCYQYQR